MASTGGTAGDFGYSSAQSSSSIRDKVVHNARVNQLLDLQPDEPADNVRIGLDVEQKILSKSDPDTAGKVRSLKLVEHLRSPFLLPALKIVEHPTWYIYETPLSHNQTPSLKDILDKPTNGMSWRQLLVIGYHVSEGIHYLHSNNIIHGNIIPENVWLDEYLNARLGNFERAATAVVATRLPLSGQYNREGVNKSLPDDIYKFGVVLLHMLSMSTEHQEHHKALFKCLSTNELFLGLLEKCRQCIDRNVWHEEISDRVSETTVKCLIPEASGITAEDLVSSTKNIMQHVPDPLPAISWPEKNKDKCLYCLVGRTQSDVQTISSGCPRNCEFLTMCPSCMLTAGFNQVTCPSDDVQIHPAIGGQRAHALIIAGADKQDSSLQDVFERDCNQVKWLAMHPRVMGIPSGNVHHLELGRRKTAAALQLKTAISQIAVTEPDFFFLYYSGHQLQTDSDQSGHSSDVLCVADLKHQMASFSKCGRILIILDCCEAASSTLVPLYANNGDETIKYHAQWSSCGRLEYANVPPASRHSQFTTYLLSGLSGARKCPANTDSDCRICKDFKEKCGVHQCITLSDLEAFVVRHMEKAPVGGKDDQQKPIIQKIGRCEPFVAFFTEKSLYTFTYISKGQKSRVCLDRLGNYNGILKDLWGQLRGQLWSDIHQDALMIYRQYGEYYESLHETEDIVKWDLDDESLYVSIRTNPDELDAGRQLVWSGKESISCILKPLLPFFEPKSESTRGHKRWIIKLNQISDKEIEALRSETNNPEAIFYQSWQKFKKLAVDDGRHRLTVDVFDSITCIGIYLSSLTLSYFYDLLPSYATRRFTEFAVVQMQHAQTFDAILSKLLKEIANYLSVPVDRSTSWIISTEVEKAEKRRAETETWENVKALQGIYLDGGRICVSLQKEDNALSELNHVVWLGNEGKAKAVMKECTIDEPEHVELNAWQWALRPKQQIEDKLTDNNDQFQFQTVFSKSWQTFNKFPNLTGQSRLVVTVYKDITVIAIRHEPETMDASSNKPGIRCGVA